MSGQPYLVSALRRSPPPDVCSRWLRAWGRSITDKTPSVPENPADQGARCTRHTPDTHHPEASSSAFRRDRSSTLDPYKAPPAVGRNPNVPDGTLRRPGPPSVACLNQGTAAHCRTRVVSGFLAPSRDTQPFRNRGTGLSSTARPPPQSAPSTRRLERPPQSAPQNALCSPD